MAQPPSDAAPVLTETGTFTQAWRAFFANLGSRPAKAVVVQATSSPLAWTAPGPGSLVIQGGTITGLNITRGREPVPINPITPIVPLATGDVVMVAFGAAPGLVFLPS